MPVTKDSVKFAAEAAGPYVGRAIRDEEFRENLRAAFAAARSIYEDLGSQGGISAVATRAATDEDVHANLRRAMIELRQAADRLQQREREQTKSHAFRNIALLVAGIVIGVFFNPLTGPETRRWVKGKVASDDNGFHHGPPPSSDHV